MKAQMMTIIVAFLLSSSSSSLLHDYYVVIVIIDSIINIINLLKNLKHTLIFNTLQLQELKQDR